MILSNFNGTQTEYFKMQNEIKSMQNTITSLKKEYEKLLAEEGKCKRALEFLSKGENGIQTTMKNILRRKKKLYVSIKWHEKKFAKLKEKYSKL